ncbi:MAG: dTDP-4-amino-4,6-dideoxy-D-galactose acyltransferase [Anaerophaga sp.]|nr:dTDP-4-amino-4,6-dideoxy-D-galactose acyltransferase [Anaerophaga sp.]
MIEYLKWDSQFFNLKIGRFESEKLTLQLFRKVFESKQKGSYNLIYLFTKTVEADASEELKRKHIYPIDEKVVFSKKVSNQNFLPENIKLYFEPLDQSLLNLALLSGHKSRFKTDNRLNHKFESLYTLWIQKSITGEMADAVFVAKSDNRIEGFVTVQKKGEQGQIGLIAVAPEAQGKGIGSKLLHTADYWYWQNNLKNCSVVTQIDNTAACALYEKNGYCKERMELVFHI